MHKLKEFAHSRGRGSWLAVLLKWDGEVKERSAVFAGL